MYKGRFAPSPTGPLHLGSLVAAAASYLDARSQGGEWLVRMEDVDEPRCSLEHAETILRQLEAYGFTWDGEVVYQSRRKLAYGAALDRLREAGKVFGCSCTRKELGGGEFYPGTCRDGARGEIRSWRLRVDDVPVVFHDRWLGERREVLTESIGDFVLLRADGYFAYQLAVVVDDAEQGITDVVRGADLLGSTARQIFLQRALGVPTPRYLHVPVVTDEQGAKLSKQTKASAIPMESPEVQLRAALRFLGIKTPQAADCGGQWRAAIEAWPNLRGPS